MAVYLEVQVSKYSTDRDGAIDFMVTTQSEKDHIRDRRYRRSGKLDSYTGTQKGKEIFYGSTRQFARIKEYENTGVDIQYRIIHKVGFLMRFGEAR